MRAKENNSFNLESYKHQEKKTTDKYRKEIKILFAKMYFLLFADHMITYLENTH